MSAPHEEAAARLRVERDAALERAREPEERDPEAPE